MQFTGNTEKVIHGKSKFKRQINMTPTNDRDGMKDQRLDCMTNRVVSSVLQIACILIAGLRYKPPRNFSPSRSFHCFSIWRDWLARHKRVSLDLTQSTHSKIVIIIQNYTTQMSDNECVWREKYARQMLQFTNDFPLWRDTVSCKICGRHASVFDLDKLCHDFDNNIIQLFCWLSHCHTCERTLS